MLWNNLWYGGHTTLDYGLLTPVLSAITGPVLLAAASTVVAAEMFGQILRAAFVRHWRPGVLVFAAAVVVNVIVGRVPFALGLALGLVAVRMLQRDRPVLAAMAGLAASASSPVAGAFVVLAALSWGVARRRDRYVAVIVAAASAAPVVVGMVLYPQTGHFPMRGAALVWDLAVAAVVFTLAFVDGRRELAIASALYGVACVAAFVVSSPLGGNVSRLGQFVAAPLVLTMLIQRRRLVLAFVLAVPLVVWQWTPAVDTAVAAGRDPSTQREYYDPLVSFLVAQPGPPTRTEIPFTFRHWETAYVADTVPLARGWERQLDIARNPAFYDGTLVAATYHAWLLDNAVGYVALPDARLDPSSFGERQLLEAGVPGLEEIWRDAHWRVWRVNDDRGLVDGPAAAVALGASDVRLQVMEAGSLLVRLRYSDHWQLDGPGCVRESPGGWIEILGARPGPLVLSQGLRGSACAQRA